jgi:hypothetical protein
LQAVQIKTRRASAVADALADKGAPAKYIINPAQALTTPDAPPLYDI